MLYTAATPGLANSNPPTTSASRCLAPQCLRIGTFNVEWLGSGFRRGKQLRSDTDIKTIADIITQEANLDIAVLQELNTTTNQHNGTNIFSTRPFDLLENHLQQRGYSVAVGNSGGEQRLAIAWRNQYLSLQGRVTELDSPDAYSFSLPTTTNTTNTCRSKGLRKPLMADFTILRTTTPPSTDTTKAANLRIIGVHLKSLRNNRACSQAIQQYQISALLNSSTGSNSHDVPETLILLGDFNNQPAAPELAPLAPHFMIQSPGTALTTPYFSTFLKGKQRLSPDHIYLSRSTASTTPAQYCHILQVNSNDRSYSQYLKHISDHAPTWCEFDI